MSDSYMSHREMSCFISFSLFGFTLVIKLRNFDFKDHQNTFNVFDQKMMSDLTITSCQTVSDLSRILVISGEIRILNFIEIV